MENKCNTVVSEMVDDKHTYARTITQTHNANTHADTQLAYLCTHTGVLGYQFS